MFVEKEGKHENKKCLLNIVSSWIVIVELNSLNVI